MTVDHLVYGAPDLGTAVDDIERRLGVRAAPGGRHAGLGTHNALLALGGGAYLEIIAPDPSQPHPAQPRPFGLDALTEPRLVTWAAAAPGIEERVAAALAAGYDPGEVVALAREQPDGARLEWRLTYPPAVGDGLVPFLIDWGDSPHPSRSAPAGCTLLSLQGEHPHPERVRPLLVALGVELALERGSRPALIAALQTPNGAVELR